MGINDKTANIKCIIRDKNNKIAYYPLEDIYSISQFNLREIPLIAQRQILNDTLKAEKSLYLKFVLSHT